MKWMTRTTTYFIDWVYRLSALKLRIIATFCLLTVCLPAWSAFIHPGLLNTDADFERIKKALTEQSEPWQSGFNILQDNNHLSLDWNPRPVAVVYRGKSDHGSENYLKLYKDIAAAYDMAIMWKISGDTRYADKAVSIMNAWSSTLTEINGGSDKYLAAGIYGYEFANVAELMRDYDAWSSYDFKQFKTMMLEVFYPLNHDFLVRHNDAAIDHYWSNWDLAQMNAMLAIGVLTERRDIYNEAIDYFKHGKGNGAIDKLVWKLYPDQHMGQMQESGRDQGHALLAVGLAGSFVQMAWNQKDDLYGYDDNRLLKGIEYVAAYNLGQEVPYTTYSNSDVTQNVIAPKGRGQVRPIWEMLYNHYVVLKGLNAPYITEYAQKVRPEGGGGDYDPNSGGYDHLGFGTLLYTLQAD